MGEEISSLTLQFISCAAELKARLEKFSSRALTMHIEDSSGFDDNLTHGIRH